MRTTEQILSSKIGVRSVPLAIRLTNAFAKLVSVGRTLRHRAQISRLHNLDDNQLRDIGLTRAELQSAMLGSMFFEDPSSHLTQAARRRARAAGSDDRWI
jgi:uncharacterized protein YjiS (DUF1127 family)